MGDTQRRVGSAVFWSVFARSGRFILSMASSVIVVRGLGGYDYGVLSVVRTVLMFAVIIAGAGLGQAVLKFLPVLKVKKSAAGARKLVVLVAAAQTIALAALCAACFALQRVFENGFAIDGLGRVILIAVSLSSFQLYFTVLSNILNAYYDTRRLSIANIVSHAVYIGLLFVFMPAWGVIGVVAAGAAGNLVACLMVMGRASSYFRAPAEGAPAESAAAEGIESRRLLAYSMPFAVIGILNAIVWRQSETLFLARFCGPTVTGYFDLAYRLPQTMLEFIPGTVWPIIMAGFSELYSRDSANLAGAIEKYYKVLFILCAPICVFGVVLGGSMVPILFGDEMAAAALPTQIFFVIFTVSFFATPLSMSLYVIEKSSVNMLVYAAFTIVNVGLDLLLIPRYGLMGAMIPVGLVILLSPFVYYAVVSRYIPGIRIPFPFIRRCFAASSPILLLVPFLHFVRTPAGFVLAALAALPLAAIGFKAFKVLGDEETGLLGSIPLPLMGRILKFFGS
ncbi:MAG: oligosaccharide flippase family protein [Chitinivibrionia bacterium]|nr:oligosaccharide flippase family protein [Chitinivibrionia bacterium]